ncbi:purine nucleoside permease [Marasmius fiardii PR-910]|nr:purine nucleoside permease [Marasmius fiardii PR-910]
MWNPAQFIISLLVSTKVETPIGVCDAITKIAPKVFILNMFDREADVWYNIPEFNLLSRNISISGFSPRYPDAHCTEDGSVCQLITGEGEINAAITMSTLVHSSIFDLSRTYFLISGISGINPKRGTTGTVTLARFAVQVALQHEIDSREIPSWFSTGYFPLGSRSPDQFPASVYGTEVFELNNDLRLLAYKLAQNVVLHDTPAAQAYRIQYPIEDPAARPPSVALCDTATADVFWTGNMLAETVENITALLTDGEAMYCTSQQEDNATLEALLRGSLSGRVDFSRIIIMRTGSNFDRPFPGRSVAEHFFSNQGGFEMALKNTYIAGVKIVQGILEGWEEEFYEGVEATNYIGDILGSLGGHLKVMHRRTAESASSLFE